MNQLSLKMKLFLLCGFLSGLSIVVGTGSYFGMRTVVSEYNKVASQSLPKIRASDEMYLWFRRIRIDLRTLGLPELPKSEAELAIKNTKEAIAAYEEADKRYRSLPFTPGERELYDQVHADWTAFKQIGAQALALYESGKPEDLKKMLGLFFKECPDAARAYTASINRVVDFHQKNSDAWVATAKTDAENVTAVNIWLICLGVFFGCSTGFYFAISISKTIQAVAVELLQGAEQVTQAANQISASSTSVSQAASEQASSLEETVATMEELTSMVQLNTDHARQASRLSSETRDIASKGEQEIGVLVSAIQEISADSRKIEDIINVIDDIAFQTNLLALNAAVEAARAGEQGKGFAVVAEAVRNLAQRSAVAAKDISHLIQGSVAKIEEGSRKAALGGEVLNDIVKSVKKVSDLNNEIASASEEQSSGITQINQTMNQLDQVTQANASGAEQTAATSEELSSQAEFLKSRVTSLKALVDGARSVRDEASPAKKNQVIPFRKAA